MDSSRSFLPVFAVDRGDLEGRFINLLNLRSGVRSRISGEVRWLLDIQQNLAASPTSEVQRTAAVCMFAFETGIKNHLPIPKHGSTAKLQRKREVD